MAEKIIIGCKLPNGFVLHDPAVKVRDKKGNKGVIQLNGANKERIIGSGYGTTVVDAEAWARWKKEYAKFGPYTNGLIFEAKSQAEAEDLGKTLEGVKTGFEGLNPEKHGVKKATED